MMLGVWGERLMWVIAIRGALLMSSSDRYIWKTGLRGELDYIG